MMRRAVAVLAVALCGCSGVGPVDDDLPFDEVDLDAAPPAERACVPHGPVATATACEAAACTADPTCCTSWDGWCAELAAGCLETSCQQVVAIGSDGLVHAGTRAIDLAGVGPIRAMDWLDADGDGGSDLIVGAEGGARMILDDGTVLYEAAGSFEVARWGMVDADDVPDAIFAGADEGIFWVSSGSRGKRWIVQPSGAPVTDVLPIDIDEDGDTDLIVTYADAPALFLRQTAPAVWQADDAWRFQLPGHVVALACDLSPRARRELVLAGPAGVEIHVRDGTGTPIFPGGPVVPGVDGISAVACGYGELGVVGADRPIQIIDVTTGAVTWDSSQLDPPVVVRGAGIAFGSEDGQPIWAITVDGATGEVPYLLLRADGLLDLGIDPAPDLAAGPVQIVDLGGR